MGGHRIFTKHLALLATLIWLAMGSLFSIPSYGLEKVNCMENLLSHGVHARVAMYRCSKVPRTLVMGYIDCVDSLRSLKVSGENSSYRCWALIDSSWGVEDWNDFLGCSKERTSGLHSGEIASYRCFCEFRNNCFDWP